MIDITQLVASAYELAEELHEGQIRKRTGLSYFEEHLRKVAEMAQAAGGTSEMIAAALLHDAIEDQPLRAPRTLIDRRCGRKVLNLVLECTEIGPGGEEKAPWLQRKQSYLKHLDDVSAGALLISVADKLQSARDDLAPSVQEQGNDAYDIFRKAGKDLSERKANTLWFHRELAFAFQERWYALKIQENDNPVLDGIEKLIEEFSDVVAWLDAA